MRTAILTLGLIGTALGGGLRAESAGWTLMVHEVGGGDSLDGLLQAARHRSPDRRHALVLQGSRRMAPRDFVELRRALERHREARADRAPLEALFLHAPAGLQVEGLYELSRVVRLAAGTPDRIHPDVARADLFADLREQPDLSPRELVHGVIDRHHEAADRLGVEDLYCAWDLRKLRRAVGGISMLAGAVVDGSNGWVAEFRFDELHFFGRPTLPLADLGPLLDSLEGRHLQAVLPPGDVGRRVTAVRRILSAARIGDHGGAREWQGLSMYVPLAKEYLRDRAVYEDLRFARDTRWDEMLTAMYGEAEFGSVD